MSKFEEAIKRIEKIEFEDILCDNISHEKASYEILMNEFIRRGNIFKREYEKSGERSLAIFSASKVLDIEMPDKVLERIKGLNLLEKCGWTSSYACESYLEWSYLYDAKNPIAVENQDLYEPIIKLLERGGVISYRENLLCCGRYYWPKNSYKSFLDADEFDISEDYLDRMDGRKDYEF